VSEIVNVVLFSFIGLIVSLVIVVIFFKRKKQHKDFKAVIFTFSIFSLICIYLSVSGIIDIMNVRNGQTQSSSGSCEIVKMDNIGGRFGSDAFFQVLVNNLTVEANYEEFSFLEEGTYSCTIHYSEKSRNLIDIQFN